MKGINESTILFSILSIVWSIVTIYHKSELMGYLTIIAIEGLLGFTFVSMPFCYVIGFNSKDALARGMSASFILLAFYSINRIWNFNFVKNQLVDFPLISF